MAEQSSAWILYALGAFVMFGITNFLLKFASVKGVPSVEGTVVLWLATGLVGALATLTMIIKGMFNPLINPRIGKMNPIYFIVTVVAGFTLALGMYFLKSAVTYGKAGPATAIALSNAVLVATLSWLLLRESLSVSELIGMSLYVAAILIFALKPLG
ncbi:MAG: hypothetical protein DRO12_02370 [Thermoprotei archaeon]|nr:MAG: hypothetical protein DRO12_02370 [Thermoprotei archaeon]